MDRQPHDHGHGHGHDHGHEPGPEDGNRHETARQTHNEMVAANRAAARQLLPAALAEIEARAGLPLEGLPLPEFAGHLDAIVRAAHAALFLKQVAEEG